ncbi:glycosyltransferase [Nonomuraea sp. MG754425]|uniref:glycosyltransferase n=1 Tax=Nonomuraea sp. MG754425 TaxID=2570319 RepID=UPI001F28E9E2|nr:glycosyltransferase [Nonomuraea sp. MG754425]MCF6473392.1 glycosyltransferase [Nonomuraea sp. MG754425]
MTTNPGPAGAAPEDSAAPAGRPRILLVINGAADRRVGGYGMRCRVIAEAIDVVADLFTVEVGCPRPASCAHRRPEDNSLLQSVEIRPPRDRLPVLDPCGGFYCPVADARLLEHVRRLEPHMTVVSGLELFRYLDSVRDVAGSGLVMDLHNVESQMWRADTGRSAGSWDVKAEQFAAVERAVLSMADGVWVCSDDDRRLLAATHGVDPGQVAVVPNAVPIPEPPVEGAAPQRVLFPGTLDYLPNVVAAHLILDEICPLLARRASGAQVVIAGARPGVSLMRRPYPHNARLVPDPTDLEPLWRGSVLLVPLLTGGGSRFKILEAFARGCPVVSTAKGIEGIDAVPGVHYLRAETAEDQVDALATVLDDALSRGRLTAAAHELVSGRYGTRSVLESIRGVIQSWVNSSGG